MKIISFCLFGSKSRYRDALLINARIFNFIYPGWTMVVYAEDDIETDVVESLQGNNVTVIHCGPSPDYRGLFWRHRAIAIPGAEVVLFRDSDTILTPRDKAVVDKWLASDKDVYTCRDHPLHYSLIMAGIWGVRGKAIETLQFISTHAPDCVAKKSEDESFLAHQVYHKIKKDLLVFSDFHIYRGENGAPPGVPRANYYDYLGKTYRNNDGTSGDRLMNRYWVEKYLPHEYSHPNAS